MTEHIIIQKTLSNRIKEPYVVLVIAIIVASFAAITIRLTQNAGLPSLVIASGRLLLAAMILTPIVLTRHRAEIAQLSRIDILWSMGAGFWIAMHFTLLIFSLEYTSVMLNQVITNTSPIWVGLLEVTFLGQRFHRRIWFSLVIVLIGGSIIGLSGNDVGSGSDPGLGNLLALGAAFSASIYLTIGRKVRAKVSIIPYVWIVFGCGGLVALTFTIIGGIPLTGYPMEGYFWLVLLTLGPQLIAHTGFNYVVGYISATIVSMSTLSVTVGAMVIAFFLFAEVPTIWQLFGSIVIISGVVFEITGRTRLSRSETRE